MPTYKKLLQERDELLRRVAEQEKRIAFLEKALEELQRKGKRQAAPFSKGEPKADPKPPGRKAGAQYGSPASRPVPRRVDETVDVQCPLFCASCHGQVVLAGKESQYQIDLPAIRPVISEFVIQYGRCQSCGRRAQGRHPRQISSALGVGGVQLGPGVISWAAYLNKTGGLSYGKIAVLLKEMMGLEVARSTLCRAMGRLAKAAEPSYEPYTSPDEQIRWSGQSGAGAGATPRKATASPPGAAWAPGEVWLALAGRPAGMPAVPGMAASSCQQLGRLARRPSGRQSRYDAPGLHIQPAVWIRWLG